MFRGCRVTKGTVNFRMGPILPGEDRRRKVLACDDLKVLEVGAGERGGWTCKQS